MVFEKKNITDIDQAKATKYGLGGKERLPNSNEIKSIFDPLVNASLLEIQDLAELFNEIVKAEQSTSFDQALYDRLSRDKVDKKKFYETINKNNNQYDLVIGNLFSKKQQTPPPGTPTDEAGIRAQIGQLQVNIANLNEEINKKNNQLNQIINNNAIKFQESQEAEQKLQLLEELRDRLTDKTGTTPISGLSSVVDARNYLQDIVVSVENEATQKQIYWKTNLKSYSAAGRKWIAKGELEKINKQVVDILKDIGQEELKTAIDSASHITDKSGAKTAVDDLFKTSKWNRYLHDNPKLVPLFTNYLIFEEFNQEGSGKNGKRRYTGQIAKIDNKYWPLTYFNDANFIRLMNTLFPKGDSTNSLLQLKDKNDPNKKWELYWRAFTDEPGSGEPSGKRFALNNWVKKNWPNRIDELKSLKSDPMNLDSVIEFYHDVFTAEIISEWDNTHTGYELNRTIALNEINFIKSIRVADGGKFDEKVISDEELANITKKTVAYSRYYPLSKKTRTDQEEDENRVKKFLKHTVNGSKIEYSKTDLVQGATDFSRYLYIGSLKDKINEVKNLVARKKSASKISDNTASLIEQDIANLEIQLRENKDREEKLERKLDELKTKDIDTLKSELRSKYHKQPYLYTLNEIDDLKAYFAIILEKEKLLGNRDYTDQDIKDAEKELREKVIQEYLKRENFLILHGDSRSNSEKLKSRAKTFLQQAKKEGEEIKGIRKLLSSEESLLADIDKALKGELDDTPSTALDKTNLQKLLGSGITVDDTVLNKFKTIDGSTLDLEKIKKIFALVGADHNSKDATKFEAFMGHLTDKKKITGATHDEIWKKFLTKKDSKEVIEIIIEHAFEDDTFKSTERSAFDADTTVDKTKYEGDDGLKQYIYEKYLGKAHTLKEQPQDENEKDKKSHFATWWWAYLIGAIVVLGAIVAIIFWENIKNWWEPQEENKEKDEENE